MAQKYFSKLVNIHLHHSQQSSNATFCNQRWWVTKLIVQAVLIDIDIIATSQKLVWVGLRSFFAARVAFVHSHSRSRVKVEVNGVGAQAADLCNYSVFRFTQ